MTGGGTGTLSFASQADFTIDTTTLQGTPLFVGLLDPVSTGTGFAILEFKIVENGTTSLDDTFTSASAANTFFNDTVVDLGSVTGATLDVQFDLNITAAKAGDSYREETLLGVPEPSSTGCSEWLRRDL